MTTNISRVAFRAAGDFWGNIHDGPSSNVQLNSTNYPGSGSGTIGEWFNIRSNTINYAHGLSQYDGDAIYLRFEDWDGSLFSSIEDQNVSGATANSRGLAILFHELLHKKDVTGGIVGHGLFENIINSLGLPSGSIKDPYLDGVTNFIQEACFK